MLPKKLEEKEEVVVAAAAAAAAVAGEGEGEEEGEGEGEEELEEEAEGEEKEEEEEEEVISLPTYTSLCCLAYNLSFSLSNIESWYIIQSGQQAPKSCEFE